MQSGFSGFIFCFFEELIALQPTAGSCYVLSASEPFNEDGSHMMPMHLKAALRRINAKRVFPVHTENPQLLARFMADLKGKTTLVEKAKQYELWD